VNASHKVLLAAAIVAVGYGAAALCGRPNFANLLRASPAGPSNPLPLVAESSPTVGPPNQLLTSPYSARLVPDTSSDLNPPQRLRQSSEPNVKQPQEAPPALLATDTVGAQTGDSIYAFNAADEPTAEPRAKLRDEAPRPLGIGPRADAVAPRVAPFGINSPAVNSSNANGVAPQSSTTAPTYNSIASTHAQPASGTSQHIATPFPTSSTSGTQTTFTTLTPLPVLSPTDAEEPRTHIVVDGDSLAKLAGRYLNDPRRAEEILELNRGLLSDPDLLPIGVELLIPPRAADRFIGSASPQSYLPRAVAVHSAHGNGLVPVRPVPSASTLTPRARLVNPRSAD
jgi:nucleoid-associated protein YgaU